MSQLIHSCSICHHSAQFVSDNPTQELVSISLQILQCYNATKSSKPETLINLIPLIVPSDTKCCLNCINLLQDVASTWQQLEDAILKLKSAILSNFVNSNGKNFTNLLVADLNPEIILERAPVPTTTNVQPVIIKDEIEDAEWKDEDNCDQDQELDTGLEGQFADVLDDNESDCDYVPEKDESTSRDGLKKETDNSAKQTEGKVGKKLVAVPQPDNSSFLFGGIKITQLLPSKTGSRNTFWKRRSKFQCGSCNATLVGFYNMKYHIKQEHLGLNKYGHEERITEGGRKKEYESKYSTHLTRTPEGLWKCGICGQTGTKRSRVRDHVRSAHTIKPKTEAQTYRGKSISAQGKTLFCGVEIIKIQNDASLKFQCGKCLHVVKSKANCLAHIQLKHQELKPFVCDVPGCGVKYAYKHQLRYHLVSHKTEQNYICEECGVRCKRSDTLKAHVRRVHKQEKKWICHDCGKGFYGKGDFDRHRQTHGERAGGINLEESMVAN